MSVIWGSMRAFETRQDVMILASIYAYLVYLIPIGELRVFSTRRKRYCLMGLCFLGAGLWGLGWMLWEMWK